MTIGRFCGAPGIWSDALRFGKNDAMANAVANGRRSLQFSGFQGRALEPVGPVDDVRGEILEFIGIKCSL